MVLQVLIAGHGCISTCCEFRQEAFWGTYKVHRPTLAVGFCLDHGVRKI